jgi:hypothetical protein
LENVLYFTLLEVTKAYSSTLSKYGFLEAGALAAHHPLRMEETSQILFPSA